MRYGWINGILGLWMIVTPFLAFSGVGYFWNDLIIGIVVAVIGLSFVRPRPWQAWVSILAGLWLAVVAFVPAIALGGLFWNNILSGIVIAVAGFSAMSAGPQPIPQTEQGVRPQ